MIFLIKIITDLFSSKECSATATEHASTFAVSTFGDNIPGMQLRKTYHTLRDFDFSLHLKSATLPCCTEPLTAAITQL